jgi:putative colanic acid biosynthesis acetyltransferase WcaF
MFVYCYYYTVTQGTKTNMKAATPGNHEKVVQLVDYDNSWYQPGSKIKMVLWLVINQLFFNNGIAVFNGLKCALLRLFGATVGRGVVIKPSVSIKYPWYLNIGNDVWIGEKVWIDNLGSVTIGNNVCISQEALLLTGNHNYKSPHFDLMIGTIILEDGVWIGARATVCPGVCCKTHSVLMVSSVATKDLDAYSIYQGVPAAKVKTRLIS